MTTEGCKEVFEAHLEAPLDFAAMTREEARVAIAKDVLARIELGQISGVRQEYFSGRGLKNNLAMDEECAVCAVGAATLAVALRKGTMHWNPTWSSKYPGMTPAAAFFTAREWNAMIHEFDLSDGDATEKLKSMFQRLVETNGRTALKKEAAP